MSRTAHRGRRLLGQFLAALLLLQWGAAPAQALALATLQLQIDSSICLTPGSDHPAPDRQGPWADVISPALHALDHLALLPPPQEGPPATAWVAAVVPEIHPAEAPMAPRAPPLQPRAPPEPTHIA